MKLKFLGTGTSQGIPVIGSDHPVCKSNDPKDKRLRTSAILTTDAGNKILIDCGPDFRQQMLTNNETRLDAVLLTHEHNDHIIGLDDLRPLIFQNEKNMPIYCSTRVKEEITQRFPYAFSDNKYPGAPSFDITIIEEKFSVLDTEIEPIEVMHGKLPILGFKIKNLAYITDANFISNEEKQKLKNLDVLIINCLRKEKKHHSHYILPEVLDLVQELQPKQTYFTHISNNLGFHHQVEKELPKGVFLAYDTLEIEF